MITSTKINDFKINQLTEEQYKEAKANNELNENELYLTNDDIVNDATIDNLEYSTEEKWTGYYWIDGKKIYRKVLTGLIPNAINNWNNFASIGNLKTMINIWGIVNESENVSTKVPKYESSNYYVSFRQENGVVEIIQNGYGGNHIQIVIEYTKK